MSECESLASSRKKQREYVAQLAERHYMALLSFFQKRNRNIWDSEELTQEVFFKILKRSQLPEQGLPLYYIYTIAWSVLRDRVRQEQVRRNDYHISAGDVCLLSHEAPPEQHLIIRERFTRFMEALKVLPARQRKFFLLSRYKGYTYAQIAEQYGISISAVEKQMMKALARLNRVIR